MPPQNLIKTRIKVILWGKEIGTLTWMPTKKNSYFNFSQDYFNMGIDICPITHPVNDPTTKLAIYGENERLGDETKQIYQSLPPFIADSLPDKWGNAIFDKWFAENKNKHIDKNPLTKLSFIGKRAMGALEFIPEINTTDIHYINIDTLYQEALVLENELSQKVINPTEGFTDEGLKALGTSAGGRQMKIIMSITKDGKFISGKTSTDKDCKHYILKFNDKEHSLSEIEKTYYELAILSGITMTHCDFLEINGTKHFITERFDRANGEKIFTQTLAAINPEASTYEDMFRTCRRLNLSEKEITELFRRTAFNFLMNNTDDHKKNFSFLMGKDGIWHLSPAYDLTFIISTEGNKPETIHCMSLRGKYTDISKEELIAFAKENNIKNPAQIIRQIETAKESFTDIATKNGINPYYTELISKQFRKLSGENESNTKTKFNYSGHKIEDLWFEKTPKGNIHMYVIIKNQKYKLIVTPKKDLYNDIIEQGFNSMSLQRKKEIYIKYLYPIIKNKITNGVK